ncbi:hypothetical protein BH23GEM11_BH23GEM11_12540 [soil metagenome]
MKRLVFLPAMLLLLFAACQPDAMLAPDLPAMEATLHRGDAAPADRCFNVRGTVVAEFAPSSMLHPMSGDAAVIEGQTSGDVVSHAYAWVDFLSHPPADPSWSGAIQIRMRHLYVDPDMAWTVWTKDEGVLAPVGPGLYRFNNRLEVAGGSGAFDEATGWLRSHGTVDFAANEIVLEYHGRLCSPAP